MIRRFSPYKKISEVPVKVVQAALITIFKNRGVPKWIKVDHGRPFGDPQRSVIPPLALWLIGMGIQVIWNRPRTPTDNAKVERGQGTLAQWIEFEKCEDSFDLQLQVWDKAHFYNYHFPIRKLQKRKRIEAFPSLGFTGRPWKPQFFELQPVLDFLAQGCWERKVSTNGQVNIYGRRFSVGTDYKHQNVSIKLCPHKNQWNVFDAKGQLIKSLDAKITSKALWNLHLSAGQ